MKNKLITLSAAIVLVFCADGAHAGGFEKLRSQARNRTLTPPSGSYIEGTVVSDYRSLNMELNPNTGYDRVDLSVNLRTAYLQNPDGRFGFRLVFDGLYDNRLKTGDRVRIDLTGCTVTGEAHPERYTITGLKRTHVELLGSGTQIPAKTKKISELTDDDLYTLVTLTDVEFLSKQGSYANVFEQCVQSSRLNAFDRPSRRTDGWAAMLRDNENASIYMLVNTKCAWRRDGRGVPHGVGSVTGVVVHTPMRRYGGDMGRYSIRPRDERDIAIPRDTSSSYRVIAEWNWNRNYDRALRLEKLGYSPWIKPPGVANDRILADIGEGFLWTDTGAAMRPDTEYDTRYPQDGEGRATRAHAAVCLDSKVSDWFQTDGRGKVTGERGLVVETSTAGIIGRGLSFDFTFIAGNHDIDLSWGFPVDWKVSYSTDGENYTDTDDRFVLRAIAYADKSLPEIGMRMLSYDAALGFTEHSVVLPLSLLGQERVFIRLTPASTRLAAVPENPADDSAGSVLTAGFDHPFALRLGMASLKALK